MNLALLNVIHVIINYYDTQKCSHINIITSSCFNYLVEVREHTLFIKTVINIKINLSFSRHWNYLRKIGESHLICFIMSSYFCCSWQRVLFFCNFKLTFFGAGHLEILYFCKLTTCSFSLSWKYIKIAKKIDVIIQHY